jgi:hypothetical protein
MGGGDTPVIPETTKHILTAFAVRTRGRGSLYVGGFLFLVHRLAGEHMPPFELARQCVEAAVVSDEKQRRGQLRKLLIWGMAHRTTLVVILRLRIKKGSKSAAI